MKITNIAFATALILTATNMFAQDTAEDTHTISLGVPEVALLDLESETGTAISLNGTAPTEAGEKVIFDATNNDIWINYSSIIGSSSEPTRTIEVQITDGEIPAGLELTVLATKDAGHGDGTMGKVSKTAILLSTTSAQKIIDGVGSSYTGNGANKGHNLTYSLSQKTTNGSYADLDFNKSQTISITYTLSDN
ncbi:MAG: hypothetical protein COB81_03320 [Flavobacteriaceae bacterium]|nr:MAG: hypothetical protein COB81_03320 [Flavobacteriaceae bacterium]